MAIGEMMREGHQLARGAVALGGHASGFCLQM
jgi:hypothetical protein